MINIKYDILRKPLEMKKTHDVCVSKKPALTVVFIHGIASSSDSFIPALKYLEGTKSLENVRFVAFDLLGSGQSYTDDSLEYGYKCQLDALKHSIDKLNLDTPLVMVGHSMGTLIATRYAYDNKKAVKHLILISPPVYPPEIMSDPAFIAGINAFKKAVVAKDKKYEQDRAFNNEVERIVKNRYNYQRLKNLTTKTTLI